MPYKGSKNAIAEWIVEQLPEGDVLVDLFCGGGAITHAAMLSRKWKRFIMNDIDGRLPILFKDCAYGKYNTRTHPEWIDRKTFNERKVDDAYIALVWSFGNNGKVTERLFTNQRTYDRYGGVCCNQQLSLF